MSQSIFYLLNEHSSSSLMAFIGGFVDAAGYLQLQGLFTSSITGNLVVACASIYDTYGVLCRALVSIFFFLGSAITAGVALRIKSRFDLSAPVTAILLFSFQCAVIIIAIIIGVIYDDKIIKAESLSDWHTILMGSILGFSMGVHNAVGKECIPNCPSLTVITMTLVTVAQNLSQTLSYLLAKYSLIVLSSRPASSLDSTYRESMTAKYDQSKQKLIISGNPLISFLFGALIGTVTTKYFKFYCLVFVLFILLVILADIIAQYCITQSWLIGCCSFQQEVPFHRTETADVELVDSRKKEDAV